VVTSTVTEVNDGGIEVSLADGVKAFIRRSDLAPRPQRPAPGALRRRRQGGRRRDRRRQGIAENLAVDQGARMAEEKEAVAQFGSSDSGASLGDILGAALRKRRDTGTDTETAEEE